jgi:recombinational DNA repair ATPase RecF
MRIKKVKWNNHPILGNLELDFSKGAGQIYENILFAGENGTGKTSILESMSTFLNKGSFEFFEYIEYEVNGQIIKAIQPEKSINKDFFDIVDATNTRHKMHTNKNNLNQSVDENPLNIRYSGCVFSKARADFKTQQIKHTTTKELDKDKYDVDNEDDFT